MKRSTLLVACCLAVLAAAAIAMPVLADQQVIGSPDVAVYSPDNRVSAGQAVSLPVYVQNSGDVSQAGPGEYVERVTTARGLTFEVEDSDAPISVETGRYPVGTVPQGTRGPYGVSLTVDEDADPGTYRIPVRVRYSYTYMVIYDTGGVEYRDSFRNRVEYLEIEVRDEARFDVVEATTRTRIGGQGNVTVTFRNVGTETARDASVRLTTGSDEITLGTQSGSSSAYAGEWQPGENRTVSFSTRVASDAVEREYPLGAEVTYEDEDGISRSSQDLTVGFVPLPAQTFALEDVTADLHVGETGTVSATVRNTGQESIRNGVVVFTAGSGTVQPVDTEAAVGRLGPDESAFVSFDVAVARHASAGQRQLNFTVAYRDGDGNRQRSDPLEPTVTVGPERDWLAVTPGETTAEIDSDNRVTVELRNTQNTTLRDLQARVETTDPFSSEAATAYVDRLEPGEAETVAFGLTVSDDAVPAQSSVVLNVTAERADGRPIDAGRYVVPVTVTEGSGPGNTTLFVGGLILVALALAGGWYWLQG
jgi:hypothetical protein